jgi:hypothetical protein
MLERSPIDVSVASPERIINEGPRVVLDDLPDMGRSLKLDMSLRTPAYEEGEPLRCDGLETIDDAAHTSLVEADRERNRDASLRQAFKHYNRHDLPQDQLEALVKQIAFAHRRCFCLPLDFTLRFKGRGWVSVRDVLNNPEPYISPSRNMGPTLLDPLEPNEQGRDYCARLYRGTTGRDLFIRSFMHGETYYLLAPDVQDARAAAFEGVDVPYEVLAAATAGAA